MAWPDGISSPLLWLLVLNGFNLHLVGIGVEGGEEWGVAGFSWESPLLASLWKQEVFRLKSYFWMGSVIVFVGNSNVMISRRGRGLLITHFPANNASSVIKADIITGCLQRWGFILKHCHFSTKSQTHPVLMLRNFQFSFSHYLVSGTQFSF